MRTDSETLLAILDGVFLPLTEMNVSVESNMGAANFATTMKQKNKIISREISGTIVTRRDPNSKTVPNQLRIYTSDTEFLIWNISFTIGPASNSITDAYEIEFMSTDWNHTTHNKFA